MNLIKPLKINNWTYSYQGIIDENIRIKIEGRDIPKEPELLSKFFALNERNVIALIKNQLYASQPEDLNDLFDSFYLKINSDNVAIETVEKVWNNLEYPLTREIYNNDEFRIREVFRNTLYRDMNQAIGLICMTDLNTNENSRFDLMWATMLKIQDSLSNLSTNYFRKILASHTLLIILKRWKP